MADSSLDSTPPPVTPAEKRLDSWKEIAAYLNRDVTTAQRWEKREGMPVHRHQHDRAGSVYAFGAELDSWLGTRRATLEVDEASGPSATVEPEGTSGRAEPRTLWLALGGLAVLTLFAAAYVMVRRYAGNTAPPKIKSLAVLPLKNLSGDPSQDYLADGITEALIGRLASIRDLRVISRTSSMSFKNTQLSLPEIAGKLRVDAIVEGSVIREGNRIRVHAQLIRAATDEHFWSESYDRELQDALALESDVAQSIARKVEVTITGKEYEKLTQVRSVSPEVYENYLKGLALERDGNTQAGLEKSIGFFREAIHRDPTFAPAYVGLATAHFGLSTIFIGVSPARERAAAMSAAQKAIELDPESVDAHLALADLEQTEWHWAEAEAEYRRALELDPGNAGAHGELAGWLACQGRIDEALTWARRGRELDPIAVSGVDVGWILFLGHRPAEAVNELRADVAVHGEDPYDLWILGFALNADQKPQEAIPVLEKALSVSGRSPGVIGVLVRAYAHAGRRPDAMKLLTELKKRQQTGYVPAGAFINAYLGLGDYNQAFAWLERGYSEHSNILQFLKVHPFLDPLRGDPRFADLLHRVGLDQER